MCVPLPPGKGRDLEKSLTTKHRAAIDLMPLCCNTVVELLLLNAVVGAENMPFIFFN
jgi:hypothetical protein